MKILSVLVLALGLSAGLSAQSVRSEQSAVPSQTGAPSCCQKGKSGDTPACCRDKAAGSGTSCHGKSETSASSIRSNKAEENSSTRQRRSDKGSRIQPAAPAPAERRADH